MSGLARTIERLVGLEPTLGTGFDFADYVAAKREIIPDHTCQCPDPDCGDCGACSGDHHAELLAAMGS